MIKKCKQRLSKAKYVFTTRIEYIDDILVLNCFIYITMRSSSSTRVNNEIERFINLNEKKEMAVFALRKDTSTNLLAVGLIRREDVSIINPDPSILIKSDNGKFYRVNGSRPAFRIRIKRGSCFNVDVKNSSEFLNKIMNGSIGFVCPKMSSGKTPYKRGLLSLLGSRGKTRSEDERYNRRNATCFQKI